MEMGNIEHVVRIIAKEHIASLSIDPDSIAEYIIRDISRELASRMHEVLDKNGEIVLKKTNRIEDDTKLNVFRYEESIAWQPFVRCKKCKYYLDNGKCSYYKGLSIDRDPNEFCSRAEEKEKPW